MRFVQPSRLMAIYALVNTVLAGIGVLFPGWIGVTALLLTSFFMSLMYPTIFAQGIRGLGESAKLGGSLIVMAIVGGAVLTPAMGLLSVRFGSTFSLPSIHLQTSGYCSPVRLHRFPRRTDRCFAAES
jgi:FHS family L-fucose permease-like MFS transporter